MKKIYAMIFVAAATLAGCQNYNDGLDNNSPKIKVTADVAVADVNRTALVQNEGVYSATWKAGDVIALIEFTDDQKIAIAESAPLATDAVSAKFDFKLDAATATSYTYIAASPRSAVDMQAINKVMFTLPSEQAPATMDTFDGAADLLISQSVVMDHQPTSLLAFSAMKRLSAVGKMTVKNLSLAESEVVESVTFECGHELAGLVRVKVNDLADANIPLELKNCTNAVTVTLPTAQSGDFTTYFSCLPTTLATGDAYTVTVKTSAATYQKVATVASTLSFRAGDITTFSVNMSDAASKTKAENLNEAFVYAIGYTTADGKTYLLNRTATTRNPQGGEVTSLGLSIDSKGTIVGEVPEAYVWNYSESADGKAQFYYMTGSGNRAHLIACNKNQGIAIQSKQDDGTYNAHYTSDGEVYGDIFTFEEKEGGYYMNVAGARYLDYIVDLNRFIGNTKEGATGVVNFYRIQKAAEVVVESLYPVITKAAEVVEGTYAILAQTADGTYYALPNEAKITPSALTIDQVSLTIENGAVTAANVGNDYKWVITQRGETTAWDIRSAVNMTHFLWARETGTAFFAIGDEDTVTAANSKYKPDWTFFDVDGKGMQMQTSACTNRHAYINITAGQWMGANSATNAIVLVKLSDSTSAVE